MSIKPRLTSHQAEVMGRLRRRHASSHRPVPEGFLGSVGALSHLLEKGYARVAKVEYGPRGGERRYWEPVEDEQL